MEIKTKFNLMQKVYFLQNNKVRYQQIDFILVRVYSLDKGEMNIEIHYQLNGVDDLFDEKDLFATKEELLKSL